MESTILGVKRLWQRRCLVVILGPPALIIVGLGSALMEMLAVGRQLVKVWRNKV